MNMNWQTIKAIATLVSAAGTTGAAFFSLLSVIAIRKQVRATIRPQLIVYYKEKERKFKIRNVGMETAMHPKIDLLVEDTTIFESIEAYLTGVEATAIPKCDEKAISFKISATKNHNLLSLSPTDPALHAIFNPADDKGKSYKIAVKYSDISSYNTYKSLFKTTENGTKHLYTRRIRV